LITGVFTLMPKLDRKNTTGNGQSKINVTYIQTHSWL